MALWVQEISFFEKILFTLKGNGESFFRVKNCAFGSKCRINLIIERFNSQYVKIPKWFAAVLNASVIPSTLTYLPNMANKCIFYHNGDLQWLISVITVESTKLHSGIDLQWSCVKTIRNKLQYLFIKITPNLENGWIHLVV